MKIFHKKSRLNRIEPAKERRSIELRLSVGQDFYDPDNRHTNDCQKDNRIVWIIKVPGQLEIPETVRQYQQKFYQTEDKDNRKDVTPLDFHDTFLSNCWFMLHILFNTIF